MKKAVSAIFLVTLLVFLSPNAHAIQMAISVEGTIIDNTSDALGWGGEPFTILFTIDSEKSPYFTNPGGQFSIDVYEPDFATFTVGGIDQSIDDAKLHFYKNSSESRDMVTVQVQNDSEGWFLESDLQLPHCFLGPYPVPASALFSLEDGEMFFAKILELTDSNPTTEIYDLSVIDFKSNPVPEPATMLLLGSGLVGLAGLRKRLRKS